MATEEKKNTAATEPEEVETPDVETAETAEVAEESVDVPVEAEAGESSDVQETEATEEAESAAEAPVEVEAAEDAPEPTDKKAKKGKKEKAGADTPDTEAVEEENKLPMKWYVIHTYSGHENKVKENILKMVNTSNIGPEFGRLIVPTEEVAEMKKGKKTVTTRKFFPSYILIEMFMSDESWHLVNAIPGVTSFVGTGAKPQPLSGPEVERILGRMDKERETIIPEIPFTLGEHIRIKDGPFSDFTGVIDEINSEKGKLRVLVSIFGRETPVELDFLQVEPV